MRKASGFLIGTHDFQSFTSLKANTKPTVRTINYIDIKEEDGLIVLEVNGNGFLLNMVRIITGTLIEVGKGTIKPNDVEEILQKKSRAEAGPTAAAKGLCLKEIQY
jgi:tRNA pseudouridine38-40 synthase